MSQLASLQTLPVDLLAYTFDFLDPKKEFPNIVQISKSLFRDIQEITGKPASVQSLCAFRISFLLANDFFLLSRERPIEKFDLKKYNKDLRQIILECICTSVKKKELIAIYLLVKEKRFSFVNLFKILDTNFGTLSPHKYLRSRALPPSPSPTSDKKLVDEIFKKMKKVCPHRDKKTVEKSIRNQLSVLEKEHPFSLAPLYEKPELFNCLYLLFEAVTKKLGDVAIKAVPTKQLESHRSITPSPGQSIEVTITHQHFVVLQPSPIHRRRHPATPSTTPSNGHHFFPSEQTNAPRPGSLD